MAEPDILDELIAVGVSAVADANHQNLCACRAWPEACLSGYTTDRWEHGDEATFLAAVTPLLRRHVAEEIARLIAEAPTLQMAIIRLGGWVAKGGYSDA
jgi:hypothetical protein